MTVSVYQLDDTLQLDFTTQDPSTGEIVDADSTPAIEIYENGGTAAMATPTPAKRDTGTTGQYTFSQGLTAGAGFEVGKTYNVYALATVNAVDGGAVIAQFRIQAQVVYAA
jgi:hypothetical protein